MENRSLRLVLDAKATLGEGPCWDQERGVLYWVDILENKFSALDPIRGKNVQYEVGKQVGAVVPASTGEMILATDSGFKRYLFEEDKVIPIIDPEAHIPTNRFNDGKCDAQGRFWAGTMDGSGKENSGSLYCLSSDGSCRKLHEGVGISNGLAWSPDQEQMESAYWEEVGID